MKDLWESIRHFLKKIHIISKEIMQKIRRCICRYHVYDVILGTRELTVLSPFCFLLSWLSFGGNQVEVIDEISVFIEVWEIHQRHHLARESAVCWHRAQQEGRGFPCGGFDNTALITDVRHGVGISTHGATLLCHVLWVFMVLSLLQLGGFSLEILHADFFSYTSAVKLSFWFLWIFYFNLDDYFQG